MTCLPPKPGGLQSPPSSPNAFRSRRSPMPRPPQEPAMRTHHNALLSRRALIQGTLAAAGGLALGGRLTAAEKPKAPFPYVQAKAYHIPPETTTEESGYFSLC